MFTALLLGLGALGGWLAKDLGGKFLARVVARSGRIGYAPRECGFYSESVTEDGRRFVGRYDPDNMFVEERVHYLRLSGDLYNDSDVPILLTKATVMFWGAKGPVIRHTNTDVLVGGERTVVITVPAHGRTAITLALPLFREQLDTTYASTIPVLTLEEVSGRQHDFRAGQTSFYGPLAAWPRKGKLPVLLLHGLYDEAETDEPKLLSAGEPTVPIAKDQDRDRAV